MKPTINYAAEIVSTLEKNKHTKDFIIGFLTATLNGVSSMQDIKELEKYLERSLQHAKTAETF